MSERRSGELRACGSCRATPPLASASEWPRPAHPSTSVNETDTIEEEEEEDKEEDDDCLWQVERDAEVTPLRGSRVELGVV